MLQAIFKKSTSLEFRIHHIEFGLIVIWIEINESWLVPCSTFWMILWWYKFHWEIEYISVFHFLAIQQMCNIFFYIHINAHNLQIDKCICWMLRQLWSYYDLSFILDPHVHDDYSINNRFLYIDCKKLLFFLFFSSHLSNRYMHYVVICAYVYSRLAT